MLRPPPHHFFNDFNFNGSTEIHFFFFFLQVISIAFQSKERFPVPAFKIWGWADTMKSIHNHAIEFILRPSTYHLNVNAMITLCVIECDSTQVNIKLIISILGCK